MSFGVTWVFGECLVTVTHTVGFHICLGYYVQTVLVAEVIPTVVVRIVAGTYSIDIKFFHYFDILEHTFH